MSGLFAGTPLERPVTCEVCERPMAECACPRDGDGRVLRPCDQVATIRLEKRKRGKVVTTVSGLDPVASDLAVITRRLKGRCGAGGTVSDEVIELQGDHREVAAEALAAEGYGVRR